MANSKNFEDSMAELENILKQMSDSTISLDDSIELYAKAANLISESNKRLKNAKVRIEEINQSLTKPEADK